MKNKKLIGWGILVAAVLVFAWLLFKKKIAIPTVGDSPKIIAGGTGTGAGTGTGTSAGSGTSTGQTEFPLKNGSRGDKVKKLQSLINYLLTSGQVSELMGISRPSKLAVDGIFGDNTEHGCRFFFGMREISEALYNSLMISYNGKF